MELNQLLEDIKEDGLLEGVLSNPTGDGSIEKVKIRPIKLKEETLWQITVYQNNQVFHTNCSLEEALEKIAGWIGAPFKQAQIEAVHFRGVVLVGKKGTMTIKKKQKSNAESQKKTESHNREKNYILTIC